MGHRKKSLFTLLLACSPLVAQINPDEQLRQAFVLEQQGQFGKVIAMTKALTESNQLSSVELGRACITLGVAYEGEGEFAEARDAFERSLHILDHDPSTRQTMLRPWTTTLRCTTMLGNRTLRARCG